jgi:CHAT domain-containing protein/tetratricopeptide (TPR) repeat protein
MTSPTLLLVVVALLGQAPRVDWQTLLPKAESQYRAGRIAEANVLLEIVDAEVRRDGRLALGKLSPTETAAANRTLVLRADCQRRLGQRREAAELTDEYLRRLLALPANEDLKGTVQETRLLLGDDLLASGDYPGAEAALAPLQTAAPGTLKPLRSLTLAARLAWIATARGQTDAARSHAEDALRIGKPILGPSFDTLFYGDQVKCLRELSSCESILGGKTDNNGPLLEKLLSLHTRAPAPFTTVGERRETLLTLAQLRLLSHDPEGAEHRITEALQSTDEPADDPTFATLHASVGTQFETRGDVERARAHWQTALKRLDRWRDRKDPPLSTGERLAVLKQGRFLNQRLGLWSDAIRDASGVVELEARLLGQEHPRTNQSRLILGSLHGTAGDFENALPLLRESVSVCRRSKAVPPLVLASELNNLAAVERGVGNLDAAQTLFSEALALRRANLTGDSLEIATSLNNLASVYGARGQYARAVEEYRQSAEICRRLGEQALGLLSTTLLNEAIVLRSQGQIEGAIATCRESLRIHEQAFGVDSLGAAAHHDALSTLYRLTRDYASAYEEARRTLEICDQHHFRNHPTAAAAHYNLGVLCQAASLPESAERHWAEALRGFRANGQSLLVGRTWNRLGTLRYGRGDRDGAEAAFREALQIRETAEGAVLEHYSTLCNLARVLRDRGEREEATEHLARAITLAEQPRRQVVGVERERADFLGRFAAAFDVMADWSVADGKVDEVVATFERSRNRTFLDQIEEAAEAQTDETLPAAARPAAERERELRVRVASLSARLSSGSATKPSETEELRLRLATAQTEYAEAYAKLRAAATHGGKLVSNPTERLSMQRLQREVLRPDEHLLLYYLGESNGYVVSVPPGDKACTVYPLRLAGERSERNAQPAAPAIALGQSNPGQAVRAQSDRGEQVRGQVRRLKTIVGEEIADRPATELAGASFARPAAAALVGQYVEFLRSSRKIDDWSAGSGKSEQARVGRVLADTLFPEALRKQLTSRAPATLIVVPDGALHHLPFEALVWESSPQVKFAIDALPPIAYVPSCRILDSLRSRDAVSGDVFGRLLTVGDPAYPPPDEAVEAQVSSSTAQDDSMWGRPLERLPGSAAECREIQALFASRGEPILLLGADADERRVVGAVAGRGVVHFAVHGLVDERYDNLFGALALTPPSSPAGDSLFDGFLTYGEIVRMPLDSCELAVLSACETNVGPERPLEAASSLAQAFFAAGARHVVASHWNVSDESTRILMVAFLKAVARQQTDGVRIDHATALQAARRVVRADARWKTPRYWAPFIITGPPDSMLAASPRAQP